MYPIAITAVLVTALIVTPQFMQEPPEKPVKVFEALVRVLFRVMPVMR
jgi:hypothetical protein